MSEAHRSKEGIMRGAALITALGALAIGAMAGALQSFGFGAKK
jgi:hypothetical protein